MEQQIRMCIQTFFNLNGTAPSAQDLLEWLGASYEDEIQMCLEQKNAA